MKREQIPVKDGKQYDHYFPKANGNNELIKKGATVRDTLQLFPRIVEATKWQTKRFANEVIKAPTLYQTCSNLWHFVYEHISYNKDEDGKEQLRSPARAWRDRHAFDEYGNKSGCDCDCMSLFIVSCLENLNIKYILRLSSYSKEKEAPYQHIYPIVPLSDGTYLTLDAVTHHFNYEEPYTKKYDKKMDLEYLNGVENDSAENFLNGTDTHDYMNVMSERQALQELGRLLKRKSGSSTSTSNAAAPKRKFLPPVFQKKTQEQRQENRAKVKTFLKKGLHATNRLNPATVAVRAGILAAMKLNFMGISRELKYTYLSDADAQNRGIDMARFQRMKGVRSKLEQLFYGAGGKPENLKNAMLTGKGNQERDVPLNGLYGFHGLDAATNYDSLPISNLLGYDMYASESMHEVNGFNGLGEFGELGEPATAASIAAASSVLTVIVGMIKQVGSIIPKKKASGTNSNSETTQENTSNDSGASNNQEQTQSPSSLPTSSESASNASTSNTSTNESSNSGNSESAAQANSNTTASVQNKASSSESNSEQNAEQNAEQNSEQNSETSNQRGAANSTSEKSNSSKLSFWDKHKKWIKPAGFALGTLGLIALTYQLFKSSKKTEKKKSESLSGISQAQRGYQPKSKKKGGNKKTKSRYQPKSKKRKSIDLM
jgi:hypothetical protein